MIKHDFSKKSVRTKLSKHPRRYWQRLAVGRSFGLAIAKSGSMTWKARYWSKNENYRETTLGFVQSTELRSGLTYHQAVSAARNWFESDRVQMDTIAHHTMHHKGRLIFSPYGEVYTVGHALRDYVEWKRIAGAKSGFYSLVSLINHHIAPRLAHLPLEEFNGRHFHQLCVDVLETPPRKGNRPNAPRIPIADLDREALRKRKKTVNTLTSILRVAFGLAWDNGEIDTDRPQRCLKQLPVAERPRMIFLSRDECKRMIDNARPDLRDLILGALYTGCRISELVSLQVCDIAQDIYGIYVPPSKNYRPRYIFLPDEGMAFFLSLCAGKSRNQRVFLNADGNPRSSRYKELFRTLVEETGLPTDTVFHSLRHTYASQLIQAGTSLSVVAKQLGHADIFTVSRTYGHLAPQSAEIEVHRRFSPLCDEFVGRVSEMKCELDAVRQRVKPDDWREYGTIEEDYNWPRSNLSRFSGKILAQLRR